MASVSPVAPIAPGLEADPLVYNAMRDLALDSIRAARELLDEAAPQQQLQFLRIMLPRLMGSLTQGGEDEMAELKKQVDAMNQFVMDALGGDE